MADSVVDAHKHTTSSGGAHVAYMPGWEELPVAAGGGLQRGCSHIKRTLPITHHLCPLRPLQDACGQQPRRAPHPGALRAVRQPQVPHQGVAILFTYWMADCRTEASVVRVTQPAALQGTAALLQAPPGLLSDFNRYRRRLACAVASRNWRLGGTTPRPVVLQLVHSFGPTWCTNCAANPCRSRLWS